MSTNQKEISSMSQRQVVQIPVDNNTVLVLEWYVLKGVEFIDHCQGIKIPLFKPEERITRAFRWFISIGFKIYHWFDSIGTDVVDVKKIESSHVYHLGMRIGNMSR